MPLFKITEVHSRHRKAHSTCQLVLKLQHSPRAYSFDQANRGAKSCGNSPPEILAESNRGHPECPSCGESSMLDHPCWVPHGRVPTRDRPQGITHKGSRTRDHPVRITRPALPRPGPRRCFRLGWSYLGCSSPACGSLACGPLAGS
jgi:hypothetical protein